MTDRLPVDPETVKVGLLLETAQNHQDIADDTLKRLHAHAQGLDDVVRAEVRRVLVTQLSEVVEHTTRASHALRTLERAAQLRAVWVSAILAALPGGIGVLVVWWWLPSSGQMMALRSQQQQLSQAVARLTQSGGRIDLRHCGEPARLCVRVDRHAPSFGTQADYLIVQGY
jgi:flagellar biosynthesis/type III secretory pathway chaperone